MKRSPSETPSPPSSPTQPTTPWSKKPKIEETPRKKSGGGGGVWTAEKYGRLSEMIFASAYEHLDKDQAAKELGITKAQLVNQLTPGRSNFRKRFMEWARGL